MERRGVLTRMLRERVASEAGCSEAIQTEGVRTCGKIQKVPVRHEDDTSASTVDVSAEVNCC